MKWRPTPAKRLLTAKVYAGAVAHSRGWGMGFVNSDGWIDRQMSDLEPGDIFRVASPSGELVNPLTNEPDDKVVALVTDYPIKNYNNQIGSLLGAEGYGVPIELFESFDDLKRKGLS